MVNTVPILLGVVTIVFVAMRLVPGDPAQAALGEYASAEAIQALRAEMGLTRPLWVQYGAFLGSLARGDLGKSYITKRQIRGDILAELPYTVDLTLASTCLSLLIGLPAGIVSAIKRNTAVDYLTRVASLLGLSMPPFFLGILLLLVFALAIPLFPVMGGGNLSSLRERILYLALPAFSLGSIAAALVARMTRASMLEVMREDFIRTASAKGLAGSVVVYKHALRNALIPIVTVVGLYLGVTLGGSVVTETVFNRPGLGRLMVGAILNRDYTVVQSSMVIFAGFIVIVNLLVDLTYGFFDPRVRYD